MVENHVSASNEQGDKSFFVGYSKTSSISNILCYAIFVK